MKNKAFGFESLNNLFKQFISFWKYRRCAIAIRVLIAIIMSPFIAVFFALFGLLYVISFLINLLDSPANYLLSFVHEEKDQIKHATQAVLYFVFMPVVLLIKLICALLIPEAVILYFFEIVFGYIASLGGIDFKIDLINPAIRDIPEYDGRKFDIRIQITFVTLAVVSGIMAPLSGLTLSWGTLPYLAIISLTMLLAPVFFINKSLREPQEKCTLKTLFKVFATIGLVAAVISIPYNILNSFGPLYIVIIIFSALAIALAITSYVFTYLDNKKFNLIKSIFTSVTAMVVGAAAGVMPNASIDIIVFATEVLCFAFILTAAVLEVIYFIKNIERKPKPEPVEEAIEEETPIEEPVEEEPVIEEPVVEEKFATINVSLAGHLKGDRCKILSETDNSLNVEFEDGSTLIVISECVDRE